MLDDEIKLELLSSGLSKEQADDALTLVDLISDTIDARRRGVSDESIRSRYSSNGWSEEDIHEIFAHADKEQSQTSASVSSQQIVNSASAVNNAQPPIVDIKPVVNGSVNSDVFTKSTPKNTSKGGFMNRYKKPLIIAASVLAIGGPSAYFFNKYYKSKAPIEITIGKSTINLASMKNNSASFDALIAYDLENGIAKGKMTSEQAEHVLQNAYNRLISIRSDFASEYNRLSAIKNDTSESFACVEDAKLQTFLRAYSYAMQKNQVSYGMSPNVAQSLANGSMSRVANTALFLEFAEASGLNVSAIKKGANMGVAIFSGNSLKFVIDADKMFYTSPSDLAGLNSKLNAAQAEYNEALKSAQEAINEGDRAVDELASAEHLLNYKGSLQGVILPRDWENLPGSSGIGNKLTRQQLYASIDYSLPDAPSTTYVLLDNSLTQKMKQNQEEFERNAFRKANKGKGN